MYNVGRKASVGLLAGVIATMTTFVATGIADAATAAPAAPSAHPSAAALGWPVVREGARGERVFAIQYLLNHRIGAGLAVDGAFGPRTAAAVRTFQRRFRLRADGQVGSLTWVHLSVPLRSGNRGPAVAALQRNLRVSYGYTAVVVDGVFGPRTHAAVRAFQSRFRLPADGTVGAATWTALMAHER
jgi:peptidoglycan hydrolase-like protein with peptidoglycan-binding domain